MKIGETVKWYENYANGDIVKDAGRGMVMDTNQLAKTCMVYRFWPKNDFLVFSERDLESIKNESR